MIKVPKGAAHFSNTYIAFASLFVYQYILSESTEGALYILVNISVQKSYAKIN
jgi:hypothetical protein